MMDKCTYQSRLACWSDGYQLPCVRLGCVCVWCREGEEGGGGGGRGWSSPSLLAAFLALSGRYRQSISPPSLHCMLSRLYKEFNRIQFNKS